MCLHFLLKNINKKFDVDAEVLYKIPIITAKILRNQSVNVVPLCEVAELRGSPLSDSSALSND